MNIVAAKPHHCGQMARHLRNEHRNVLLGMGANIHRDMRDMFDASMWSRAWVEDGQVLALGGISGSIGSSDGIIWLAIRETALVHSYRLAREALRQIEEIMRTKSRLMTVVLKDDRSSVRFAYFLGFNAIETTVINGAPALMMSYERLAQRVA